MKQAPQQRKQGDIQFLDRLSDMRMDGRHGLRFGVDDLPAAIQDGVLILEPGHHGDLMLDLFGQIHIVMAEPGKVLAPHLLDTPIQGRGATPVLLVEIANPVTIGPGDGIGFALVAGAVVDHHDLDIRVGLRQRAIDGLAHVIAAVVDGNDDGDQRLEVAVRHDVSEVAA